jgi:hypothetical protein
VVALWGVTFCRIVAKHDTGALIKVIKGVTMSSFLIQLAPFFIVVIVVSAVGAIVGDKTHLEKRRKYRDAKVHEICEKAGIPLMTFWANMPNNPEYVVNRILGEMNK